MTDDRIHVVVTTELCRAFQVHHRDFPEVQAEGESTRLAATHLLEHLARELDNIEDAWHRRRLQKAVADLRAFLGRDPAAERATRAPDEQRRRERGGPATPGASSRASVPRLAAGRSPSAGRRP